MTDITFREAENLNITFAAKDAAGAVLNIVSGVDVTFVVVDDLGETVFDKSLGDGITVSEADEGTVVISVTADEQETAEIAAERLYFYEIRVYAGTWSETQESGRFKAQQSLYEGVLTMLLLQFRARFPEFDQDDTIIILYLNEANRIVVADGSFSAVDRPIATMYLAAHMLMVRKQGESQYATGGLTLGAVRSISIEGRSVGFGTTSGNRTTPAKSGLAATTYGQNYLLMLRSNVHFIKAM